MSSCGVLYLLTFYAETIYDVAPAYLQSGIDFKFADVNQTVPDGLPISLLFEFVLQRNHLTIFTVLDVCICVLFCVILLYNFDYTNTQ